MISVNSRRRIVTYGLHEVCMRQPWTMCLNRVIYSSDSQDHQRRSTRPDFNGYFFLFSAYRCRPPYASLLASKCQPMGRHLEASWVAYGGRHVQALQLPLLHLLLFLSLQLQRLLFTCFCQSCFFIQGCRDISLAREENIYFSLSLEESWAVRLFSHELFLFLPSD